MYSTELIACGEFLAELNCKQGQGVVELGAIAANSYHELVTRDDNDTKLEQSPEALNTIEIVESVDSGLYGKVYKGLQSPLNRYVAVKIIKDCDAQTADVVEHARLLTRVQHPAVVTVYSVQNVYIPEFEASLRSIVMEWLEGTSFGRRLAKARFATDEAVLLCRDVGD